MHNELLAVLVLVAFLNACTTSVATRRGPTIRSESQVGPVISSNLILVPESRSLLKEGFDLVLYEEKNCEQLVRKTYKEMMRLDGKWGIDEQVKHACSDSPGSCLGATFLFVTVLPFGLLYYPFMTSESRDVETGNLIESDWGKAGLVPCGRVPVVEAEVDLSIPTISFSAKGKTDSAGRIVLNRAGPGIAEMLQAAAAIGDEVEIEVGHKNKRLPLRMSRQQILENSVDMSESVPELAADPVATFSLEEGKTALEAGATTNLLVQVTNRGKGETSQLKAVIQSPNPLLNGRELLFGKILPGKHRVWVEPVNVPLQAASREVPIRIVFSERNGYVPEDIPVRLAINARGRPRFAYSHTVRTAASNSSGAAARSLLSQ
jgi:hypothetical protein